MNYFFRNFCLFTWRECVVKCKLLHFEWHPCTLLTLHCRYHFEARSQSCVKRLLASLCLSLRPSVRPSVRTSAWKNSAPTGRIFMKLNIWVFFQKTVKKMQASLKSDKINGYFTWRPLDILIISRSVLLRMRNVWDKIVEEIKTFSFNRVVYETIWKIFLEPNRTQMTIWPMPITCWIPKATNTHTHTHTHRLCNTHCYSTATIIARKRFSVTLYLLCQSCFFIIWDIKFHVDACCRRPNKRAWGCDTNHCWAISKKRNTNF